MEHSNLKRASKRRYITGLDGIRAIAVMGVIIFHLLPDKLKGGYFGVAVFFVVSGYLITDLLLKEWRNNDSINVWSFYFRRLRRLYPALLTMLFSTGAYMAIFQRNMLKNLGTITWHNMLYIYNWWEIYHGQNYFDRFQGESPFTHLWTLSIEGQFYFVWPIVLIILLALIKNREQIVIILFLFALLSALWMSYLYHLNLPINRIYYGTDTRLFSILFGVTLAFIWPADKLKQHLSIIKRGLLDLIGVTSLVLIIVMMVVLSGESSFTYNGGMLIISFASTLLVATCVHPGADINGLLTNRIFKWLGTRSYGIYLYQFPVMIFYESRVTLIGQYPILNAGIELALIGVISEGSYRFIERPLRHYNYRNLGSDLSKFFSFKRGKLQPKVLWGFGFLVLCLWTDGVVQEYQGVAKNQLQSTIKNNQKIVKKNDTKNLKRLQRHVKVNPQRSLNAKERKIKFQYALTDKEVLVGQRLPITAIGDSILADSSVDIQKLFPNAYISAAVGRQVWQASDVIKDLRSKNELSKNIVINLGTNSPMQNSQLSQVVKLIGPKHQIYWVNCHVPTRYWEGSVNKTIAEAAKKYSNVHLIDWYSASVNHPEYFWSDHIHPNPNGNVKFAALIARDIAKNQN